MGNNAKTIPATAWTGIFGLLSGIIMPWTAAWSVEQSETIVVTATRTPQIADETIAPVIVISQEEIEASQARDISDLLRLNAGMEIGKSGGTGQQASLFMRGAESDQVIVMIDGVKINASSIQQPAIQNISLEQIERVEIVKGPRSALYGSEGIGGVVNIITKRVGNKNYGQVKLALGGDNTSKVAADLHAKHNKARGGFSVSRLSTSGFPSRTDADKPHAHSNDSAHGYIGYQLGSLDMEVSHWQAQGNTEYRGPDSVTFIDTELDQDFKNAASALTLQYAPSEIYNYTLKFSNIKDELTQNQSSDFANTHRNGVDVQVDAYWNRHQQTTIGLNLLRDEVDVISFGTPNSGDNDADAIFLQHNTRLQNHHLVIAGRYSSFDVNNSVRTIDDNTFTYNIDYAYRIGKAVWIAGTGTGYRIPSLLDLATTPEKLVPEESVNYEAGLKYRHSAAHTTEVNIYQNEIDNLLVWNPVTFQMDLVAQTRIRGLEITHKAKFDAWQFRSEVSAKDPKNLETDRQLDRRAKFSLNLGLDHYSNTSNWHINGIFSSDRYDGATKLAGYGVVNIGNELKLGKHTVFRSKIDNVFNKQYQLVSGYNTRDRFIMFEIQHAIEQ